MRASRVAGSGEEGTFFSELIMPRASDRLAFYLVVIKGVYRIKVKTWVGEIDYWMSLSYSILNGLSSSLGGRM